MLIYFEDLTPYSYHGDEGGDNILNVGWLSKDHDYPRGSVPPEFVERLNELIAAPVNLFRGFHICEFCPSPNTFVSKAGRRMLEPDPERHGNGEIRVTGDDGVTYVAPVLIRHYVSEHEYRPTQAFINAVLNGR